MYTDMLVFLQKEMSAKAIAAKELPAPSVTVTPEITAKVELELPAPRKRTVVLDGPDGKTTMEIQ